MVKVIVFILAIASGIVYRTGGIGFGHPHLWHKIFPKWMFHSWVRDFFTPFFGLLSICLLTQKVNMGVFWSLGLGYGAMTSYFKKKGTEAKLWNWMLVGLAFGLCLFPFAYDTGLWKPFIGRTIMLFMAISTWSELVGNADWEELGRGFLFTVSTLLFA